MSSRSLAATFEGKGDGAETMETRANFVLVGFSALAVIAGAFMFVLWFSGLSQSTLRKAYTVQFLDSVAGLSPGSGVYFNGVRVGEVKSIDFVEGDPSRVAATIEVDAKAPIRKGVTARLDQQLLTSASTIALGGVAAEASEFSEKDGKSPIIVAERAVQLRAIAEQFGSVSAKADDVLGKISKLVDENGPAISDTLRNVDRFSQALAANSDGLKGALAGIADLGQKAGPLADKLSRLADDADSVLQGIDPKELHGIVADVKTFTGTLARNSDSFDAIAKDAASLVKRLDGAAPKLDAALESFKELGPKLPPLAQKFGALADDVDAIAKAVDGAKVGAAVSDVAAFAHTLSDSRETVSGFLADGAALAKSLKESAPKLDAALASFAELGPKLGPIADRIGVAVADFGAIAKAVDGAKVGSAVSDVAAFARTLADSRENVSGLLADGAALAKSLKESAPKLDSALGAFAELGPKLGPIADRIGAAVADFGAIAKAVDGAKVGSAVTDVAAFAHTLADSRQNVSGLLESGASLAKRLDAAAPKLDEALSGVAGLVKSFDAQKIGRIVDDVGKFAGALGDNNANVDRLLKDAAAAAADIDAVAKAVDGAKVGSAVSDVAAFARTLADSRANVSGLLESGASLAKRLDATAPKLDEVLNGVAALTKSFDAQKLGRIVDDVGKFAGALGDNKANVDRLLKDASEFTAKINSSADKVDGVLASAQSFLGSPGTKGALGQVGDAAASVKTLADNLNSRVREIEAGLARFSNSGLREYEALAVDARRAIADVDRLVRSLEKSPNQVIFGTKSNLPEFKGTQ